MSKSFILFLATLSLICCIPVIRKSLNFDEKQLAYCLKQNAHLDYNEQIEELRSYRDELRYYLYLKKFEEYKIDKRIESIMLWCFDTYGEKAPRYTLGMNCYDECHDKTPGQVCNCPRT